MKTHHTQIIPVLIIRNYRNGDLDSLQIVPFANKEMRKKYFNKTTKHMNQPIIENNIHRFQGTKWDYEYEFTDMVFGEETDLKAY